MPTKPIDDGPFMLNPRIRYHDPLEYSYRMAIDERVSLQARGFYAYLLALAVDHVDNVEEQIAKDFPSGAQFDTAMAAADELEGLGYLERTISGEANQ